MQLGKDRAPLLIMNRRQPSLRRKLFLKKLRILLMRFQSNSLKCTSTSWYRSSRTERWVWERLMRRKRASRKISQLRSAGISLRTSYEFCLPLRTSSSSQKIYNSWVLLYSSWLEVSDDGSQLERLAGMAIFELIWVNFSRISFRRTDLFRNDPSSSRNNCQSRSSFQLAAMKLTMLARFMMTDSSKPSAAWKIRPRKSLMSLPELQGMLCLRLTRSDDSTIGRFERSPLRTRDSIMYLQKSGFCWARTQLLSLAVNRSEASSKQLISSSSTALSTHPSPLQYQRQSSSVSSHLKYSTLLQVLPLAALKSGWSLTLVCSWVRPPKSQPSLAICDLFLFEFP